MLIKIETLFIYIFISSLLLSGCNTAKGFADDVGAIGNIFDGKNSEGSID